MILGLGTDLIEVARIRHSYEKFGAKFTDKFLRPAESAYCLRHEDPVPLLAARFAAKEAIAKAFGTGITGELGWLDMEVANHESGAPYVILHAPAERLMQQRGAKEILLTISHTDNYATATAILQ